MRKIKFYNGEYYHIFNRGVDKREVFKGEKDYLKFLKSMREFNRLNPVGSLYEKDYRDKKMDYNKKESNSQLGIGFPEDN